jgi:hypothetical protein
MGYLITINSNSTGGQTGSDANFDEQAVIGSARVVVITS